MIMKQLIRGHLNSFRITIVRRYGNFDHLHFFQPITGQQTNWNTNACDVIGWKKCRWSKFRRTLVQRCYGLNLGGHVLIQSGYRGIQTHGKIGPPKSSLIRQRARSIKCGSFMTALPKLHTFQRPWTPYYASPIINPRHYGRPERK